jgi:hypothetical protein
MKLCHIIISWLEKQMTEQFKIALIGFAAAVVGGMVTGFYHHARDWWTKPRLSLDYVNDPAHFVDVDRIRPDGTNASAVWVRVRARNTGRRTAKGCRIFLVGLEEVHTSGTTSTPLHDSPVLGWPGGKDFAPRDIPRGVDFYADVVHVSKQNSDFLFSVNQILDDAKGLGKYRGTYRFHILITADDADPAQCKIDVTYDGDWNHFRAVPSA